MMSSGADPRRSLRRDARQELSVGVIPGLPPVGAMR